MAKRFLIIFFSHIFTLSSYALEKDDRLTDSFFSPSTKTSGYIALTNNYMSEGVSNTNNNPALQAQFSYIFNKYGVYLALWGSNTDFVNRKNQRSTAEIDINLGIRNKLNEDFIYDFYINKYNYHGAPSTNYVDLISNLTYKFFTWSVYFSPDVFGRDKIGLYNRGKIAIDIAKITIIASIGYYKLPHDDFLISYSDYMVGAETHYKKLSFTLEWTDTSTAFYNPFGGNHIVGTLQYNF